MKAIVVAPEQPAFARTIARLALQLGSRPIERLLTGPRPTPHSVATAEPARGVLREIATEEKKVWAAVSGRALGPRRQIPRWRFVCAAPGGALSHDG